MAVRKLIQKNVDGSEIEYAGKAASAGAGDSGEFITRDATGKIDPTNFPNGFGADAVTVTAGEAISAGDFVYFNAAGAVLKADATIPAKAARAYSLAAIANAGTGPVYFDESNSSLAALTPGLEYYLSTTAGGVTITPPVVAGQIAQSLGIATSATSLHVNIGRPVTRS